MKKFLAFLFSFFFPFAAHALYVGNPAEPQLIDKGFIIAQDALFSFKLGYEGDWVFDRKLKAYGAGDVSRFEIQLNQGVATLNFLDRLEVSVSSGSFNTTFWNRLPSDGKLRTYESKDIWTVGGDLKLLIMQWGNVTLGVDGKYQYAPPRMRWVTVDGTCYNDKARLSYKEWQVGVAVGYTVDIFSPYIGAKYSNVHAHVDELKPAVYPHPRFQMANRERFGMVVGCGLSSGKIVDLNVEVRLIDEQAVTLAGNVKF